MVLSVKRSAFLNTAVDSKKSSSTHLANTNSYESRILKGGDVIWLIKVYSTYL